ncbi:MAG: matrixin family metalloprotease [Methanococcoides sp.]|nr:matrixin family metalloprotease [Methanococcoides sp.]
MKLKFTIISILLICTLVSPAFGALGEKEYPRFFDEPWDHSPITVYIDDVNTPLHYSHTYRTAIVDATKYWENGGNGKLYYNPDFEIVDNPNADIYVMWVETMEEVTGAEDGVAGYCRPEIAAGRFVRASIVLEVGDKRGYSWQQYGDANMEQIAIHEFGHALGLDHSNDKKDIMYPSYEQRENVNPLLLEKTYPIIIAIVLIAIGVLGYLGTGWLRYHKKIKSLEDEHFKK